VNWFILLLIGIIMNGVSVNNSPNPTTNRGIGSFSELVSPTGRSSTYVIAASDSSNEWKAQANKVCTGTNDTTDLTAAFTASSIGGILTIAPGTYDLPTGLSFTLNTLLSKPLLVLADGAVFSHTGNDVCLTLKDNLRVDRSDVYRDRYMTILGLEIAGTSSGLGGILLQSVVLCTIERPRVYNYSGASAYGIKIIDEADTWTECNRIIRPNIGNCDYLIWIGCTHNSACNTEIYSSLLELGASSHTGIYITGYFQRSLISTPVVHFAADGQIGINIHNADTVGTTFLNPTFDVHAGFSSLSGILSDGENYHGVDVINPSWHGSGSFYTVYNESTSWSGYNLSVIRGRGVTNHTGTTDTLQDYESGYLHTNYGDTNGATVRLPAFAPSGTYYKFAVQEAQEFRVRIHDTGGILYANGTKYTDDGGGDLYISADDEGESLELTWNGVGGIGGWVVTGMNGTWTVTQP
jgi:hypothetical protein